MTVLALGLLMAGMWVWGLICGVLIAVFLDKD